MTDNPDFTTASSAEQNEPPTPVLARATRAADGTWHVRSVITAVIEVPASDAQTAAEAEAFAADLKRDLELRVTIGGVPLKAQFSE